MKSKFYVYMCMFLLIPFVFAGLDIGYDDTNIPRVIIGADIIYGKELKLSETYPYESGGGDEWIPHCNVEYNSTLCEVVNTSGLVGFWKLNNNSAYGESETLVYDYSGNGNNGTPNGAVPTSSGYFDGAYEFDGVDDNIQIPYDASLDSLGVTDKFTIEAWVYPKGVDPNYESVILTRLIKPASTGVTYYFTLSNRDLVGTGEGFMIASYVPAAWRGVTTNTEATTYLNNWYHVVGTFDTTDDYFRIYVNGELKNSKQYAGLDISNYSGVGAQIGNYTNTYPMRWNGTIDSVRIYNRTLGIAEIVNNYNGTIPTPETNITIESLSVSGYGLEWINWTWIITNVSSEISILNYTLYYSNNTEKSSGSLGVLSTSNLFEYLQNGTTYQFCLYAENNESQSDYLCGNQTTSGGTDNTERYSWMYILLVVLPLFMILLGKMVDDNWIIMMAGLSYMVTGIIIVRIGHPSLTDSMLKTIFFLFILCIGIYLFLYYGIKAVKEGEGK